MNGKVFPCVCLVHSEKRDGDSGCRDMHQRELEDKLLLEPLYGGAVLGSAVENLDADLFADLARRREEDAQGCAHDCMMRSELEL